jgi:hypothetical protein
VTDSATFATPEADEEDLGEDLGVLPPDGISMGNLSAREALVLERRGEERNFKSGLT